MALELNGPSAQSNTIALPVRDAAAAKQAPLPLLGTQDLLVALPQEVVLKILDFLHLKTVGVFEQVSKGAKSLTVPRYQKAVAPNLAHRSSTLPANILSFKDIPAEHWLELKAMGRERQILLDAAEGCPTPPLSEIVAKALEELKSTMLPGDAAQELSRRNLALLEAAPQLQNENWLQAIGILLLIQGRHQEARPLYEAHIKALGSLSEGLLPTAVCICSREVLPVIPAWKAVSPKVRAVTWTLSVASGNVSVMQELTAAGFPPERYQESIPLAAIAARYGQAGSLEYLRAQGVDVFSKPFLSSGGTFLIGHTPLWEATSNGKVEAAEYLICAGANGDDYEPSHDRSAFDHAFDTGQIAVINMFVQRGLGAHLPNGEELRLSRLFHDAKSLPFRSAIITAFASRGIDLQAKDATGRTVMHFAAAQGSPDDVKCIVALGGIADTQDVGWITPLDLAREAKNEAVVKWLEQHLGFPPPPMPFAEKTATAAKIVDAMKPSLLQEVTSSRDIDVGKLALLWETHGTGKKLSALFAQYYGDALLRTWSQGFLKSDAHAALMKVGPIVVRDFQSHIASLSCEETQSLAASIRICKALYPVGSSYAPGLGGLVRSCALGMTEVEIAELDAFVQSSLGRGIAAQRRAMNSDIQNIMYDLVKAFRD